MALLLEMGLAFQKPVLWLCTIQALA